MMLAALLIVAIVLVLAPCLACVYLVSPLACVALAIALTCAPAACAWCFDYLDRKRTPAAPLRVLDQGEP